MSKTKKMIVFLLIMVIMVAIMPLNIANAGITDIDGHTINSSTTLKKTEIATEELAYDTNLEEYIANKKADFLNSLSSDNEPSYKDEWLALYVAENGVYKYPVHLQTVFTGVTISGDTGYITVGDSNDLINSDYISSGTATYNYEARYKEVTVTKAENPNEIKIVNITLVAPTVGDKVLPEGYTGTDTENIIDDGTMEPDKYPIATSLTNHILLDGEYWITGAYNEGTENWDNLFFGTFKKDIYYYADISILAETGYTFVEGLTIKVNGQDPVEVFGIYDGNSTHLIAKIKAAEKQITPEPSNEQKEYTLTNGDAMAKFTFEKGHNFELNLFNVMKITLDELNEMTGGNYTDEEYNQLLDKIKENTKGYGTLLGIYAIEINDENIGYSDEVKFRLKLTDEMKQYDTFKFIYLDENNNFKVGDIVDFKVEGDYITGTLPHLSVYTLVGNKVTTAEETTTENEVTNPTTDTTIETETENTTLNNPKTGDNIITLFSIFAIALFGTFTTIKLNKNHRARKH